MRQAPTRIAVLVLILAGYGTYGAFAWQSPLVDDVARNRALFLRENADSRPSFSDADRKAARNYFLRYPDVARDGYFGQAGPMGDRGALEHYRRHGRYEGRTWQSP
jgi:hypothetical protein